MPIHPIIKYFMIQGVPLDTIILILMLPIIATIIALFRQVIGIKSFGIYTPLIITFAFIAIGLKYGVVIFISVLLTGMVVKIMLKKLRLLYLPRVAITVSIVAFVVLGILVAGGHLRRTGLAAVSIFPLLIIITIVEKFVATQIEKGNKTAILLALETLVISLVGFYVASWQDLIVLITAHPWIILFALPFNVFLGKWSGLRLSEYWRFREVIKKM